MGYFAKDLSFTPATSLTPVTMDRVAATLTAKDISFQVDDDGDLAAGWDYGVFFFSVSGETTQVLRITGRWRATAPVAARAAALEACNAWNEETLFPKAFVGQLDEETLVLMHETNTILDGGVSDGQLEGIVERSIVAGIKLFEHLAQALPEEWAVVAAQIGADEGGRE